MNLSLALPALIFLLLVIATGLPMYAYMGLSVVVPWYAARIGRRRRTLVSPRPAAA